MEVILLIYELYLFQKELNNLIVIYDMSFKYSRIIRLLLSTFEFFIVYKLGGNSCSVLTDR